MLLMLMTRDTRTTQQPDVACGALATDEGAPPAATDAAATSDAAAVRPAPPLRIPPRPPHPPSRTLALALSLFVV